MAVVSRVGARSRGYRRALRRTRPGRDGWQGEGREPGRPPCGALAAVAAPVGEVGELVGDDGGLIGEGVEVLGDADEGQGVGQVAGLVVVGVVFEGLDGLRRFRGGHGGLRLVAPRWGCWWTGSR